MVHSNVPGDHQRGVGVIVPGEETSPGAPGFLG